MPRLVACGHARIINVIGGPVYKDGSTWVSQVLYVLEPGTRYGAMFPAEIRARTQRLLKADLAYRLKCAHEGHMSVIIPKKTQPFITIQLSLFND